MEQETESTLCLQDRFWATPATERSVWLPLIPSWLIFPQEFFGLSVLWHLQAALHLFVDDALIRSLQKDRVLNLFIEFDWRFNFLGGLVGRIKKNLW